MKLRQRCTTAWPSCRRLVWLVLALTQGLALASMGVVPHDGAAWKFVTVRGKFVVTDPAQVQGLRLDVSYYCGARVFVNGTELTGAHLPAGEIKSDTLAGEVNQ